MFAEKFRNISTEIVFNLHGKVEEDCPFVFIFDEVPLLNEIINGSASRLRILRRALHALGTSSNAVSLLLGTKADYADLSPEIHDDSLRDKDRNNIFPAFIVSSNWDIFGNEISSLEISENVLLDPRFALMLFSMGRPLWSSLAISKILEIAEKKLSNSSVESGEAYFACWCIRTGLPAGPRFVDLCRHLIKSNMATLLNIHPSGTLMNVCYPSEPTLAMAASKLISRNTVEYFQKINHFLKISGINRGDLGEILTSEFCLQAMAKAKGEQLVVFNPSEVLEKELADDLEIAPKAKNFNDPALKFTNSKTFILNSLFDVENFQNLKNELHATIPESSIEEVAKNSYKVVTVKNFLISLYGQADFDDVINNFSAAISQELLNGLLNFTHFIRLSNKFPFGDLFEPSELSGKPIELIPEFKDRQGEVPNSICREIIQYGLKRSAAFFAPSSNCGVDMFLPVCLRGGGKKLKKCLAYVLMYFFT